MKLYSLLIGSILVSGFLIIGCVASSEDDYTEKNTKEVSASNNKEKISEEDAVNLIKNYLASNNSYIPSVIEVDNISGDSYIVHAYDVITNEDETHIATSGWFEVNMYTGNITDIMNEQ
ncbi:hypothetical protein [Paraclostridium bifermentans]|uniref:hypothetical protein n=1 Tax=Paraclostridium bifermentans TaxID=1490 RepID=UPI00359C4314